MPDRPRGDDEPRNSSAADPDVSAKDARSGPIPAALQRDRRPAPDHGTMPDRPRGDDESGNRSASGPDLPARNHSPRQQHERAPASLPPRHRRPDPAAARDGDQPLHLYAIGLGSNRPLSAALGPRALVRAALVALDLPPLSLLARAPLIETAPIGPSLRRYANSAALVVSPLPPHAMLDRLQSLEHRFGRRRFRRWGDRTLDLDLLLWSGGRVESRRLTVPHPLLRQRAFVLAPLIRIAPRWRDPVTGLTIAQLAARLARARPIPRPTHPKAG